MNRSDKVHESWRMAAEKLDYFVLALVGALLAYLSQNFEPMPLGWNSGTLELVALLLLVGSAVAGFRRIEKINSAIRLNFQYLRASEQHGELSSKSSGEFLTNHETGEVIGPHEIPIRLHAFKAIAAETKDLIDKASVAGRRAYNARNWLLFVGFLLLLAAKVWAGYGKV